jgi:hypothetical protein
VQAGPSSIGTEKLECEIATSYSIPKILASILQLLGVTYILWLHQGDQINRWGFASFSFVPVPYAIMSLVNGMSHLVTPDYPAVYMVSSTVMQEAEEAGGSFCGIIGHVEPVPSSDEDTGYGLSLLVIGLISGFRGGSSSKTEQIILMIWLTVGTVAGILKPFLNVNDAFTLLVGMPLEFIQVASQTRFFTHSSVTQAFEVQVMLIMCIPWSVFILPIWGSSSLVSNSMNGVPV